MSVPVGQGRRHGPIQTAPPGVADTCADPVPAPLDAAGRATAVNPGTGHVHGDPGRANPQRSAAPRRGTAAGPGSKRIPLSRLRGADTSERTMIQRTGGLRLASVPRYADNGR